MVLLPVVWPWPELADRLGPEYMFWSYGIGWVITCALSVYHYAAGKWLGKYRAD